VIAADLQQQHYARLAAEQMAQEDLQTALTLFGHFIDKLDREMTVQTVKSQQMAILATKETSEWNAGNKYGVAQGMRETIDEVREHIVSLRYVEQKISDALDGHRDS